MPDACEADVHQHRPAAGRAPLPDPAGAVVGIEIEAAQLGQHRPAVDVSAHHRAVAGTRRHRVRVLEGRELELRAVDRLRPEDVVALVVAPAEVGAGGRSRLEVVDLFPLVLADVADPHVAGCAVERESPRIAQPVRVDGRPGTGLVHVQAQDARERAAALALVVGVALAAAVAERDVQEAVGPELELAALVVVEGRLVHLEEDGLRGGIGDVRDAAARPGTWPRGCCRRGC